MIYPVILSGGAGSRLWPLSREHYPKQLLCLAGEGTLLQQTITRLDGLSGVSPPMLVCNEEHRFLVAEQVRQLGKDPLDIILEPVGRNTAPALTLAALSLLKQEENALMLVMPADHVIQSPEAFHHAVSEAVMLAQDERLVTFGIAPATPETGYGYIKKGKGNDVAAFVEKPDAETAQAYLASGDYLWNSGMFLMRASLWLEELARYRPDILDACRSAFEQGMRDGAFYRINKQTFSACPSDSIDYVVMEKTHRAAVVPLDAGWSDIGAWPALWDVSEQDEEGNVTQGDVYMHATQNTLLIAQHRFLAAVGLEDIIVIETPDAVLVAHKDHAQNVREIVNRLKAEERSEYQQHRRVHRPWGCFEGVDRGERFQVKRLTINPGAAISLQMHRRRAEHWVVVKGTAKVTRGDEEYTLSENQSTYIPIGERHRLENPGPVPLEIIEVQSGGYLGEDDIMRLEDNYNRHNQS
ncbi:MAG: mannose-1-phosphate guanylyltransferase/mannose-6-phosphate isomerase [Gammaproteobacteria bacterium]|nr:MAG: mannose-1-phosphate guanylyltransferase/mannose-6-phosphate isomerase [Gammaproteobacteria bacterium]